MMRDYDPTLGRYIEADPIGLNGGLNIYGYAAQNPVLLMDPTGLSILDDEVRKFLRILDSGTRQNWP